MKKLKQNELKRIANKIAADWVCRFGLHNAKKLSLDVRRIFRDKNHRFLINTQQGGCNR